MAGLSIESSSGTQSTPFASHPEKSSAVSSVADITSLMLSEVAPSDVIELTKLLNPILDPSGRELLDVLFKRAIEAVLSGNPERAVGYLADYATRNPDGAQTLSSRPELAPIRNQIDSMVSRMTVVAKMTAEEQLSRAEWWVTQNPKPLSNWNTNPVVILKVAQRVFEAGGYANYSRAIELARTAMADVPETARATQVMAASASAGYGAPAGKSSNLLASAIPEASTAGRGYSKTSLATLGPPARELAENLRVFQKIGRDAFEQMWEHAPLLLVLMMWSCLSACTGCIFALATRISPDQLLANAGRGVLDVWFFGVFALVGLGLYRRIRKR